MVAGDEIPAGALLRETSDENGAAGPVLFGHFTPYDRWAEINSFFEGHFMERTVKGAFKTTIDHNRDNMRVLFQHGRDPQIGMKPLGPIRTLREEDEGPYYECALLDADYVRNSVLPGLRAGLYGASYKFRVVREVIVDNPGESEHNPKGLQERTIKEAQVFEFGPVTFPAFAEASAGVRSGTDDYFLAGLANADPEVVRMAADGADFTALIAHRLGRPVEFTEQDEDDEERDADAETEDAYGDTTDDAGERDEDLSNQQDDSEDSEDTTEGAAAPPAREQAPAADNAAPGPRPTPLLGVKKESWRL